MESVELTGKSVEDAVQQALIRLGKRRDEVDVTVVSEGHRGILGFVRGDTARVKVTVRKPGVPAVSPAVTPKEAGSRTRATTSRTREAAVPSRPRSTTRSRRPAGVAPTTVGTSAEPAPRPSDSALLAKDTLEELLEKMGIDGIVIARSGTGTEDSPIVLDIAGEDLGILIGRRGETLASLQFLLNLMVGKKLGAWTRVLIDVEGYRARREETLRGLATRVADKVRRSGESAVLEPMPPNERRIVHLTLQDDPDVTTESSGFGEDRRVTVMPRPK